MRPVYQPLAVGLAALAELDRVPWNELAHGYGVGVTGKGLDHDVRWALESLAGDDWRDAYRAFYSNICHQGGTVYEATADAVPFLPAVVAGEIDAERRQWLVTLLGHIAVAACFETTSGTSVGARGAGVAERIRYALQLARARLAVAATKAPALADMIERIADLAVRPTTEAADALAAIVDPED